jgi:hypothetical protein
MHLICYAQLTQGPNNPATVAAGACSFSYSSTLAYSPAGNVTTSNNVYASVTHCACCDANTNCLTVSNFGFSIPVASVINGITVEIEKRAGFGAVIQDNGLRLMKGGAEAGSNLAAIGVNWPSGDAYTTYGGCNNLWGTTWTPADINAANFGLYFAAIDYTCGANTQSFIDHIRVTVCYSSTLPVELTYFKANRVNREVELEWETASETNNEYFIIERSADGINYNKITEIAGAGNSNTFIEYKISDSDAPAEQLYYRLTQKNFNGEIFVYNPVSVTGNMGEFEISVSYVPGNLSAFACTDKNHPVDFKMCTIQGQIVYSGRLELSSGCSLYPIPVNLPSEGLYLVAFYVMGENPVVQKFYGAKRELKK